MTKDALDAMRQAVESLEGEMFEGERVAVTFAKPGDLDTRVRCYRVTAGPRVAAVATDGMVVSPDGAFAVWITERLDSRRRS